jgi:N-acetylglucosaminyldiphosphoundecaprenol N-acetyl-beta-D-mannosaminyltransferase
MEKFIEISAEKGYKNYFLGAAPGIAIKMAERFLVKYPKLKICGIYSPPFGDFTEKENKKIIDLVNGTKPDILWVSFGCPKQEKWILENASKLQAKIAAGVGAAFDFFSGNVKRAPLFVRKARLEWFYRVLKEPGRLWKRYFFGGFKFMKIIINQKSSLKRIKRSKK